VKVLADIGIKTNRDTGLLEFNDVDFKAALVKDPTGSSSLLSKLGDKLSSTAGIINSFKSFQGLISQAENSNKDEDSYLSDKIERIETNLATQKAYLTKLFSKLEETVGKLQSNATALTSLITQSSKK
jgi:flagellar capping protein FliD